MLTRRGALGTLMALLSAKFARAAPTPPPLSVVTSTVITLPQGGCYPLGTVLEFRRGTSITTYALAPSDVHYNRHMIAHFGEGGVLRRDGGEWRLVDAG